MSIAFDSEYSRLQIPHVRGTLLLDATNSQSLVAVAAGTPPEAAQLGYLVPPAEDLGTRRQKPYSVVRQNVLICKSKILERRYLLGNLRFPSRVLRQAKQEIEGLDFVPNFGERNAILSPSILYVYVWPGYHKIYNRVRGIVHPSDPNWYTKKSIWNALKSLPGGLRQGIHLDSPSLETTKALLENGIVQDSVIIALQPNTQFYVYPGCFGTYADMDKCKLVLLDAGELIMFRGDLVHADADFEGEI
ncbi:hypothetical protein GQ600_1318 [Phytophthora cactorum]|nr:hypothetical protein GQ600_1318 [Phytophthora cactorum]